jgi:magnesium-transporting ATPase (P-type)
MGKTEEKGPLQYDLDVPAHTLPFEHVLKKLSVSHETGLTEDKVKNRRNMYGPNQLDEGPGVQPFRILVHQVANALTLVSYSQPRKITD